MVQIPDLELSYEQVEQIEKYYDALALLDELTAIFLYIKTYKV